MAPWHFKAILKYIRQSVHNGESKKCYTSCRFPQEFAYMYMKITLIYIVQLFRVFMCLLQSSLPDYKQGVAYLSSNSISAKAIKCCTAMNNPL